MLCAEETNIKVKTLTEGTRKRGRPKTTWLRTVEMELRELNCNWSFIQTLAKDRQG